MSRLTPDYIRSAAITLVAMAVGVPIVIWGCWAGLTNARNAPILWLPADFAERKQFEEFIEDFRCDEVIVVSWDGCTVDDERLKRFADELRSPRWNDQRRQHTHLTGQVLTGYEVLRRLTSEPVRLSRREALGRLEGQLVGPDGKTSCAVLVTRWTDVAHGRGTIGFILDAAERVDIPREHVRLAGAHIEGAAVDAASNRSFTYFLLPAAAVVTLLCRFFLRSWRLALAVLAVAAFSSGLVLAVTHFSGVQLNAVLVVMMPLVLVLAVSSGIHLVNYFFEQVKQCGAAEAPGATLRIGWWPCTLAAVTTSIGLSSLAVSDLLPMRQFGVFASIGVLTSLVLLFLVIPGALSWYSRGKMSVPIAKQPNQRSGWARRYVWFVCRFFRPVTWAGLLALGIGAAGMTRVETSVEVDNLLVADHSLLRDYHWLETHLGPLVPVEVLIHFDNDCSLDSLQRADLVRRAQRAIEELDQVEGSMSAVTFLPETPTGSSVRVTARRAVLRSLIREQWQQFIDGHWLSTANDRQSWRISSRVPAFQDLDYGLILESLSRAVDPILKDQRGTVTATVTGMTPVVHAAQQQLLNDLFTSFLTALLFVLLVMIFVLRSVPAGLVAMIPNVFPAVVLFGLMGWLRVKVDIGSVMTASVALGIAVDDTIHFLTWLRRGLDGGQSRPQAIRFALDHCGLAMVQTSLVCGLGLMVFALSDFIPTRRFAWMMFTLLSMALAGDLLLLPALVASPLGRVFKRRSKPAETHHAAEAAAAK